MWKTINVSQLGERLFINANKKTVTTLPVFSQPLFEFNIKSDAATIGAAVRKCLKAWTEGHPQPNREEIKHINDPLIELAGEKNAKSFFSKIKSVPVKLMDNKLMFFPTINYGWRNGFGAEKSGPIEIEDYKRSSDLQIGTALLKALYQSSDSPLNSKV